MSDDNYSDSDVLQSPWMKWGKIGDNIFGTLIGVFDKNQVNRYSGKEEVVRVYEMKCAGGEYHQLDDKKLPIDPAIKINKDEIYSIGDHFTIHGVMKNVKLGQKLKIAFTEEQPSKTKGNANKKVRVVYSKGVMDEEWLAEKEKEAELSSQEF